MKVKLMSGFTLAEVLITLGAIGVIAALTLPTLISNIHNKVVEHQVHVMNRKINQATEGMQIRGALINQYSSTSAFVEELSKDIKIISKCDTNHLTNCWPYENFKSGDTEYKISDQTDGKKAFKMNQGTYGDTMGVVFGNGVPMILTYKTDCEPIDPDSTYNVDRTSGMSETSACLIGVYDINGAKGPNKVDEDIIRFRANGFGSKKCYVEYGGSYTTDLKYCVQEPIYYTAVGGSDVSDFPCEPMSHYDLYLFFNYLKSYSSKPIGYTFIWYQYNGKAYYDFTNSYTGNFQNIDPSSSPSFGYEQSALLFCFDEINESSSGSDSYSDNSSYDNSYYDSYSDNSSYNNDSYSY